MPIDGNGPGLKTLILPVCKSSAFAAKAKPTRPIRENLNFINYFLKIKINVILNYSANFAMGKIPKIKLLTINLNHM